MIASTDDTSKDEPKKKILLIEDEQALSNILKERLLDSGYDVKIAIQGEEGWQKTKKEKPDLVLLDILLPRLDGFVYLKRLRTHKSFNQIPVIILSNLGEDIDLDKGKELGAVDYLVKSNHTLDAILDRINKVLTA
ncbi:MAG: response regulator [bacterium]|nr:response regulator [bacterium]